MKKYFDRKTKLKEKFKKLYLKGYEKSQAEMKERIKSIKIRHAHALRAKDQIIQDQKKEIKKIEKNLDHHNEIIARTKSVLARVHNDSYVQNIICNEDHGRVEKYLDEIEVNEIKFNKSQARTEKNVLKFEKVDS